MLRPRAFTGPVKWLWCILVIATFRSAECLSDADLDATLHEQDHQPISDKFLSKLRQQRPPIWHSEDAGSGYSSLDTSREALELVSVERDSEFGPAGVTKWLSVQTRHTVYAVGIAERSITLVTAHPPKPAVPGTPKAYTYSTLTTDLPEVITAAATFEVHYPEDGTTQIYAVVASGSSLSTLSWFRISDDELLQEKAWTRKLEVAVSEMAVAALSPDDFILILNTCTVTSESACRPSIDIYQFHSSDITNIKLSQSISLSSPAGPVSVGTIRDVVLLAIPVPAVGKVLLYRHVAPTKLYDNAMYEPVEGVYDNLYGYFKPHLSPINSSEVAQAVFFQQHHKTFLAVSGLSRAVYLVDDDLELTGCPIPMSKFGRVVRWVVVPIPNYRQDVVLLAQYQVETMARGAPLLQFGVAAFTYANNALQYQRDTYCYVSRSEPPLQGSADCLLLFGNPTGIDGTAVLPLKGSSAVFVLVPNGVTPSSLVGVYTKLVEAADPVIYELDALNNLRNQIEIVIAHQESAIHELELTLQDSLRTEGLNIITGAWNVEDISSSLVEVDDEGSIKDSKMIGKTYSENLGKADLEVKLEDVTHEYVQLEAVVKEINKDLRNVLLRSEDGVVELEDTLTVLGGLEVASESDFEFLTTTSLNGEPVQALFEDAVRLDNLREITSHKILPELDANNVVFSSINNIPASRLIFDSASSEPINIDGSIHFNNGLKTDAVSLTGGGKVNGIDIAQEVFVPTKPIPVPVSFDKVSVADVQSDLVNNIVLNADTFYKYIHWGLDHQSLNGTVLNSAKVEGNVMVEYVNGVYWAELVNGLVWTDQPAKILGPTSISQVVFKDGVDITTLNQLAFPGDFVVRSDPEHIITGQKTFKGGLYAAEVDATSINDVKLDSIVTLNSDQILPGALTLSQAFVGTNLKVDSKLNGVSIASINTPSPTLREGGNISANVYFDTLQVDGPVVVSQSMGNSLFTDILSDVVVVPPAGSTEPIVISGDKTLPSLAASSLTVTSGLINGLPVDGFVTTNTEQVFKNPIVSTAHIEFGNVDVNGLWDGVDVVKLKNNVMTVSGNQKTSTRLTYASPFELWASQLTIDELNEYLTDETVSVVYPGLPDHEHDVQLSENGEVVVDGSLGAGDIQVGGNVIVKGTACNVNLLEFEKNRLSLSKPQTVYSDIKVDNLEVIQLLNVSLINNMPLPTLSSTYPTAPADLEAGGYFVDELVVKGDIKTVLGMNGVRIDQVAKDAIWLDGNADPLEGNFIFTEPLYVGSVVVHNGVNGQDLELVEANAVFKGQDVVLKGATSIETLAIQGNLVTPNLLGLNPADILMRDREQIVQGLRVSGDIFVAGEVAIDRSINGENIKKIAGRYKKLGKGRHQIIGNLSMSGDVSADDVYVHGNVNNQNLQDFLASTVDKYSDNGIPITGNIVLSNSVNFVEPVTVEESGTVNGVDLSEYYQNLVLTNGSYTEIISKVVFESTVSAGDAFTVNGVVEAGTLYGCNVTGWYSDAILINEDTVLQGNRSFDDVTTKFLNTSTLNSVDMNKVIYLNEDQRIDASLNFAEITSNRLIEVGGMINGVDLKAAFRNTLLTQNDEFPIQEIVGKTFTGPVIVKGNLDALGGINDLDVTKVVTLEGDQTITSPLLFQGPLTAKSSISATTLSSKPIANINLVDWSERILLSDSAEVQTVNQRWDITGNVTFAEAVSGTGALNGIDVRSLEAMKQDVQDQIGAIRAKLTDKYKKMCFEVQALSAAAQKQPFIFRQIDAVQSLVSPPINSIHIFKVAKKTFLFVSHLYSCQGALYEWNADDTQWYLVVHDVANAGGISEWLTVPATKNGPTYLVTSAEFNGLDCNNYGGRVWKFDRAAGLEHAGEIIPWTHGKVDTKKREFFVMSKSKMATYGMDSGAPLEKHLRDLPSGTTSSMVTARSAAGDLIMKNGAVSDTAAMLHLDKFVSSLLSVIKHRDHFALFEMPDGKRLAAVFEESSRSVTIHNVDWQLVVGRISTNNARWITPLELGDALHPGQTHIAFIEEHNVLRVLQYKGEQGFVDVARIELPIDVFGMKSVWLPARGLLRDRLYLVIRGQTKVLMLEVEMLGDPLPEAPPTCDRDIGF